MAFSCVFDLELHRHGTTKEERQCCLASQVAAKPRCATAAAPNSSHSASAAASSDVPALPAYGQAPDTRTALCRHHATSPLPTPCCCARSSAATDAPDPDNTSPCAVHRRFRNPPHRP